MGLEVLENRKICPYQDSNPRPSSRWSSLHTYQPPKFYPRKGHEGPTLANLPTENKSCTHHTGGWVGPRASLAYCSKSSAHTRINTPEHPPMASSYTYYGGLAHKVLKISYKDYIRYTRSNNPQVAYGVQILNNYVRHNLRYPGARKMLHRKEVWRMC